MLSNKACNVLKKTINIHKLSKTHLVMTPQERQNVRRAAQLLSHTTAISLRRYFKNNAEATVLANFIEKVDLWFSILNSYSPFAKLDYKNLIQQAMIG